MLAFAALIDLSLQRLAPRTFARLARGLPAVAGRVTKLEADGMTAVQLADERPLPNDDELPLADDEVVVAGVLRLDAREALRDALGGAAVAGPALPSDARLVALAYRR